MPSVRVHIKRRRDRRLVWTNDGKGRTWKIVTSPFYPLLEVKGIGTVRGPECPTRREAQQAARLIREEVTMFHVTKQQIIDVAYHSDSCAACGCLLEWTGPDESFTRYGHCPNVGCSNVYEIEHHTTAGTMNIEGALA